jgi:predicted unusual protein kinase regulating ubiquinone biosynthesis (AarF/ABC1/UbiB family)
MAGWRFVHVPRVVREASTARILTAEMAYGIPLEKTVALDQSTRDKVTYWGGGALLHGAR